MAQEKALHLFEGLCVTIQINRLDYTRPVLSIVIENHVTRDSGIVYENSEPTALLVAEFAAIAAGEKILLEEIKQAREAL